MKKLFVILLALTLLLSMSALAMAADPDTAVSSEDEDYVGRDMVLEEGEAGITSVVGDDIAIGEGEFKMTPYTLEQPEQNFLNYLIFGILIIVTAGIVLLAKKKAHSKA